MMKVVSVACLVFLLLSEAKGVELTGPSTIKEGEVKRFNVKTEPNGFGSPFVFASDGEDIFLEVQGADTPEAQLIWSFKLGCIDGHMRAFTPKLKIFDKDCIDLRAGPIIPGDPKFPTIFGELTVCCEKETGSGGDPHFTTFHGDLFDYHGVCDLVLAHSETFAAGQGMDLHVRTKEYGNHFSIISNAALKVGDDILEVNKEGHHLINGVENVPLPAKLAGQFTVTKRSNQETAVFDPNVSHGFSKEELKDSILFSIDLGDNAAIEIQSWKGMLWVNTVGSAKTFEGTKGLIGTWSTPGRIARDGTTNMENVTEYAEHWQVLDTEPKLFQNISHPQHPAPCVPPAPLMPFRRLGEESNAKQACSGVTELYFDACVLDVMVTGDVEMAKMYQNK